MLARKMANLFQKKVEEGLGQKGSDKRPVAPLKSANRDKRYWMPN